MGNYRNIIGTLADRLQLGVTGPLLRAVGSVLEARIADDTGFAILRAALPVGDDDVLTMGWHHADETADTNTINTSSTSFQTAFTSALTVPQTGVYQVVFNVDIHVTNGDTAELAIGVDPAGGSSFADQAGSQRQKQTQSDLLLNLSDDSRIPVSTMKQLALTAGSTVQGLYRAVGGGTTVTLRNRILWITRVG